VRPTEKSVMAVPISFRYRFIVGAVLLAAFAFLWGIREFVSFDAYQRALLFLGVWVSKMPFSDFHAILSAAECHRLGVDVYVTNPCDFAGRVHIYSPLWLKLVPGSLGTVDTWWTGAIVAILFLLSLTWLCPARSRQELCVFLALCCSSAVLFAAVRANNDIIVFMLILIAGKVFSAQNLRPIGYVAIGLAAALKFYPLAAFAMLAGDRLRRALLVGALAVAGAVGFALLWGREVAVAARNFPVRYLSDQFSARNLIGSLPEVSPQRFGFLEPHVGALTAPLILLAIGAAVALAIRLRSKGARLLLDLEDTALFLGGGAMIVGCFLIGHNIHYRAILLLLTVPLLLAWTRDDTPLVRLTGWTGVGLVAFAVFQSFLRARVFGAVDAVGGSVYRTVKVYWVLEEVVWWTLAIGLMSAMFLIVWDSPTRIEAWSMLRPWLGIVTKYKQPK
jgi:glycosyl transferase family 87